MSEQIVLNKPTVAEVIRALSALPQNVPLTIEDADTNWTIDKIHIGVSEDGVQLFGDYSEMKS